MKIKLDIELDLPDECKDWSYAELQQLLFDEYINHATCCHLEAATKWCAKAYTNDEGKSPEGRVKDEGAKRIMDTHKLWGEICDKAEWNFKLKSDPKEKLDKDIATSLCVAIRDYPIAQRAPEGLDDESFVRGLNAGLAAACIAVELAKAIGIRVEKNDPEQEKE
jgi:hypothetical protein